MANLDFSVCSCLILLLATLSLAAGEEPAPEAEFVEDGEEGSRWTHNVNFDHPAVAEVHGKVHGLTPAPYLNAGKDWRLAVGSEDCNGPCLAEYYGKTINTRVSGELDGDSNTGDTGDNVSPADFPPFCAINSLLSLFRPRRHTDVSPCAALHLTPASFSLSVQSALCCPSLVPVVTLA